jgi:ferrous iron transport protein B
MDYIVALAGNPNCGKTTVFNDLTGSRQHVGNWPGVTVEKKEGKYKKDSSFAILDLPGTYSLSPYTEEEKIARDYILSNSSDVVVSIIDGTNIERNLYLTLQILETSVPLVAAVNMMDEVEKSGTVINFAELEKRLGIPVVPIAAKKGRGIEQLMAKVKETALQKKKRSPLSVCSPDESEDVKADKRYKFIEQITLACVKKTEVSETGRKMSISDRIDAVLTNRFASLPLFALIMYAMFALTFSENFLFIEGLSSPGIYLAGLVESGWGFLTALVEGGLEAAGAADWAYSLVIDGVMGGIGAVLGFLPLVLVLYVLLSFLEDSGYMARVAFVMDRIFRRFGLSGKSFIPLLMGFGCGVPAIMATRTLESEKDRYITTVVTGFMPCGAKLPIFAMFAGIFFADGNKTLVTFSLYFLSIASAIVVSLILNKAFFKGAVSNFIMELPQYRLPTLRSIGIHGWEKVKDFITKAGSIILVSTIILWALSNFNINSFNGKNLEASAAEGESSVLAPMDDSFLASAGKVIAPVFKPLGFGAWRPAVGVVSGWIAKEMVVVTFAQLYTEDVNPEYLAEYFSQFTDEELGEMGFEDGYDYDTAFGVYSEGVLFEGADDKALPALKNDIRTKHAAYAYMVFNLLCMPCFAAVGAMKRELKTWKRTMSGIGVQMLSAYVIALLINLIGSLFA